MINRFYQQELGYLRELAVEFSKAHPALAPMLAGASQDPDVERLLEGTAFLAGMLRQKLEDDFPEVIHGLMQLIFPHYLRPIPSTTIIAFTPKPSLMESISVPSGTELDSVPVDGTKCTFRTCYDVDVHPLKITGVRIDQAPGRPTQIVLDFALTGITLAAFKAGKLRLHVSGDYPAATTIFTTLMRQTIEMRVTAGQADTYLGPGGGVLKAVGFSNDETLLPYPAQSFPGYRVLQEYFILPDKFLFMDIDLSAWTRRGNGNTFSLQFTMKELPPNMPPLRPDRFVLFASPAANIFPMDGDPIYLDHRQPEYRVIPAGTPRDHFQVFSVNTVTGFAPGTVQRRSYKPFELFAPISESNPVFNVSRRVSTVSSRTDVFISVAYPAVSGTPGPETLSLELLCTNGSLPESLQFGDVKEPTSSSPELASFKNIRLPTALVQPPLGQNILWKFLSHLSLNLLSIGDEASLKVLLGLYNFVGGKDRSVALANEKRIAGIQGLRIRSADKLVRGLTIRGQKIKMTLNPDNFAGLGDMILFGTIMDYFMGIYSSVNCFTRLTVIDALKGDRHQWPIRLGDRPLI